MAIKRYFADADNTITNAFRPDLTNRGTNANMGESDVLETFSIYGQASSGSTELERILIKFPISNVISDRTAGSIPISGGVSFYLKMSNARHSQTVPRQLTLNISAVSRSWEEGIGLDMDGYTDIVYPGNIGSTWMAADGTTNWNCPGGDYHTSPVYTDYFDTGIEDLEVDVTSLVEQWITGSAGGGKENYGFGIHLTSSQEAYYAIYSPREAVYFDQLAVLTGSTAAMLTSSTGADTLSMWLYYVDTAADINFVSWSPTAGSVNRALDILNGGIFNQFRSYTGGVRTCATTVALTEKTWYHIAITENGGDASPLPILYVNGISQSADFPSGIPPGPASDLVAPTSFGGRLVPIVSNLSGNLDDIAYYNRVLTAAEILEIYNNGCPNNLKEIQSSKASLKNWWINGDDPKDAIRLGSPPTEISIYDQVGTFDLYASGIGDMAIVDSVCAGGAPCKEGVFSGSAPPPAGQVINLDGAQTSYYTKKFFGRGSEFYYKRPYIEARWNSSIKDDRGRVYVSSSLLTTAENNHTIYLYNIYGGHLRNIPSIGTGPIFVELFSASAGGASVSQITGGYVSTGIYSASIEAASPPFVGETFYDRWGTAGLGTVFHTGSFKLRSHNAFSYNPNPKYVVNITNLKPSYTKDEQVRLRLYTRQKDWSPTIYTVANSNIETLIIESASYQIFRIVDDLSIVPYGTSSDNCTQMSYDVSGNYFDFDMGILQSGYSYGIKVAFYDETSYVEQPYLWKFRVDKLNEY
jgi:hypothetical protein